MSFDVDVAEGFADMKITQVYHNESANPLEIVFKLPISESFSISSLQARFLLQDGSETVLETKVAERAKAQAKYDDSVASGQTAVMATLPPISKIFDANIMSIYLGNFPPMSRMILTASCAQKLDVTDLSYSLTIPMSYVPKYLS